MWNFISSLGRGFASIYPARNSGWTQPVLLWTLQKEMWRPEGKQTENSVWELWSMKKDPPWSVWLLLKCFSTQGLRFLHFPYLLTLQLKRFDFDYTTMHRIKLNDRMTFPEELDMSPFIDVEDEVREASVMSLKHILKCCGLRFFLLTARWVWKIHWNLNENAF